MRKRPASLIIHLLVCLAIFSFGLKSANAQVEKGTLWRDTVVTELDVDFGGTGFHARWTYHHCQCGDLRVQVEQVAPDGVLTGELLMVDGQVLLSRGFEQQDADIESLIQAPSLMLQLAYAMLHRSQPKGPFAVNEKEAWDATEPSLNFNLDTGLATGVFGAPWGVKGSGWKTESGHRRFEMLFEFTNPIPGQDDATGYITFSGDLDFSKQEFPYPESTSLEGWQIQWLSRNERESRATAKGLTLKSLRQQTKNP